MVEYMKEPFISKLHLKRKKKEGVNVIHITKKKSRTQRKSIINKRKENKEELAKYRT